MHCGLRVRSGCSMLEKVHRSRYSAALCAQSASQRCVWLSVCFLALMIANICCSMCEATSLSRTHGYTYTSLASSFADVYVNQLLRWSLTRQSCSCDLHLTCALLSCTPIKHRSSSHMLMVTTALVCQGSCASWGRMLTGAPVAPCNR